MQPANENPFSGYLGEIDSLWISDSFTNIELYADNGSSILLKAKRYGQWWLLKGVSRDALEYTFDRERLRKEFELVVRMQHPGIVRAHDIVTLTENYPGTYIVMEWIEGMTLDKWLTFSHTKRDKINLFKQLLAAVDYIHTQGIVHRDLKPENLIITHNGNYLKIIDFGLADSEFYSILKQPAGTEGYISPEQRTENIADVRNDIFSIGMLLKKLKIGREYDRIIRKCLGPIELRYSNISHLLTAFNSSEKGAVTFRVIISLVFLISIGSIPYLVSRKKSQDVEIVPPIELTKEPQVDIKSDYTSENNSLLLTDSIMRNPSEAIYPSDKQNNQSIKENKIIEKELVTEEIPDKGNTKHDRVDTSQEVQKALKRGIEIFEKYATIIDSEIDTLSYPNCPNGFDKPDKAWKAYYYDECYKLKLSEEEFSALYSLLQDHSNKRYMKWKEKIYSANKNI